MTTSIDKKRWFGRIRRMNRLFRKWWLLKKLRQTSREEGSSLTIAELTSGVKKAIDRKDMLNRAANLSRQRFSSILPWKKKNNVKKLRDRVDEYHSILNECTDEKLIRVVPDNIVKDETGNILNPPGKPYCHVTDKGDKYIFEFWYKISRAIFFNAYSTGIIIALVVTYSTYRIKEAFNDVNTPPVINVYPNINNSYTPPEVKPVINVYPTLPK